MLRGDIVSRLHKPKAGFWIRLCAIIIVPLTKLLYRTRWHNLAGVTPPERGGVILAMNHTSHIDTLLMARLGWQAGRIPRFMIKASLFHKPGTGQIFRGSKQIPVYRGTTNAAQSLRDAVAALARGEAIAIYPEGTITRAPGQWPMQAKTGIARLWLLSPDTPVIPIGQWGAQQRKFSPLRLVRRPISYASVGKPVDLERYRGAEPTAAVLREITDTIMGAIRDEVAALRGQTPPAEFYRPNHKQVDPH
jgi:1-acyl-sn-glycerol-3-phosphate acyltransferase